MRIDLLPHGVRVGQIAPGAAETEFSIVRFSGDEQKAAATYKALTADKGLSTDIIVHPIWEITRDKTFFGIINDEVCAKVVGYRGVIKSFKKIDAIKSDATKAETPSSSGGLFGFFK
jgi:hypothetical protein